MIKFSVSPLGQPRVNMKRGLEMGYFPFKVGSTRNAQLGGVFVATGSHCTKSVVPSRR